MSETSQTLLASLIKIGGVDAALARIYAERKKIEGELRTQKAELAKTESALSGQKLKLNEKNALYAREEKFLREERDKLTDRRKALSSHSNYKVQQAAEREIEFASSQLNSREEVMLGILEESSKFEAEIKRLSEIAEAQKSKFQKLDSEAREALSRFEQQEADLNQQREAVAKLIDPASLTTYNKVKDRYPMDPIVTLKAGSCSGCFMQLGPQFFVQLSRGDALIKCRGCARILYLEEPAAAK